MAPRSPLPKVCIALGFADPAQLLAHALAEYASGERFLEFRLDYLPHPEDGLKVIRDFIAKNADCSVLATCRRHQNHGKYNGSIEEQVRILEGAVEAGARAVDVEVESAEAAYPRLEKLRTSSCLIISYHNYDGTPAMEPVLKRLMKFPAFAYKLVTTAKKPSDCQKVLALAKGRQRDPLVLLTMGDMGFPTRVLSPALGALYTYAAPNAAEGTAAGQVNAAQLRNLYRFDKFTKAAKIYGVIANPVRHSISPAVHNRAFQSKRLDAVYLPFLVQPVHLKDFMLLAAQMPVAGFSVTIPHKQKIIRYLDLVDPLARRIGAVNTVWKKAGRWRGTNTDVTGVTGPMSKKIRLPKSKVLIIGNGGAARGAAFALADAGAQVSITGRNPDRVRALAKICGATAVGRDQLKSMHFDALVHATPIGMHPHVENCFFDDKVPADLVMDMVYNPLETALIHRAKDQGKEVILGLDMFLEQAAQQFTIWTGEAAPKPIMERAAREALGV